MRLKTILFIIIIFTFSTTTIAQDSTRVVAEDTSHNSIQATDNLMNELEKETANNKNAYTTAAFRYTKIINGQSVENLPAHVLDVKISHRFGRLNSGLYNFFGLDYSPFNVLIAFDYGITNNLMVGIGHSALQKTYDGFFKLKILRQSKGVAKMPVTISLVPTFAINTLKPMDFPVKPDSGTAIKRASYTFQLLIARKFSEGFAVQLMPTFIHADNISFSHTKPDIFAIGIAGTQKLSKRMSINAEYYYQLPDTKAPAAHNVLSFGIDIGTGGHVFELHFTNSVGLTEKSFISETTGSWDNGDIRFGFNISRVFQLGKKTKENHEWKK
jgi:Membrane bound beta barrel domain (DUF5777)